MATGTAAFLDTSIQIARIVHGDGVRARIEARLKQFDVVGSSLVVRQEFKRRLLKEAKYLLATLHERGTLKATRRHVLDVLPNPRKKQICLDLLETFDEADSDQDRTDRAKYCLRSLLLCGMDDFDSRLDFVNKESGCACAVQSIIEKKPFLQYEFGTDKCEHTGAKCGIIAFLNENRLLLQRILAYLQVIPAGSSPGQKTEELQIAEQFIEKYLEDPDHIGQENPCKTVGDLLIALESRSIPCFVTMNSKESQHLCKVLGQELIVRRPNPEHPDVECPAIGPWQKF